MQCNNLILPLPPHSLHPPLRGPPYPRHVAPHHSRTRRPAVPACTSCIPSLFSLQPPPHPRPAPFTTLLTLLTPPLSPQALQQREKHIPYRNSKLTRLLEDSLGANSK